MTRVQLVSAAPVAVIACFNALAVEGPKGGRGADGSVRHIELAEAADLDEAAWGGPVAEDGRSSRHLRGGACGAVPVPCWWGRGMRPKKGGAWRAEITFKDTARAPVRVELFAGLPGRYEIHRIGGLADGEWRSARVPIPWDQVCRVPGEDHTEIVLHVPAGADLPVEAVAIVPGSPDEDEVRWASETRDWVVRVQAAKRAAAGRPAAGTPVLFGDIARKRLVPFVRSTSRLVYDSSAPQDGETGVPVRIVLATNEIEPAQFGVYANGGELGQVRVGLSPSGLKGRRGRTLAAEVELFAAEYSVVSDGSLFPQRLWPAYSVDVADGRSHLFWINVTTEPGKSRPGTYRGEILIQAEGVPAETLPLEVEVLPVRLLTMKEAGLHMGGCTKGLVPAHELEFLARHNHNSINLWYHSFQPEMARRSRTDFDLDFAIPDDFMRHAREAGIENFVYFLGGDPYGFPDTLSLERELYRRVHYDGTDLMEGRKEFLRKTGASPDAVMPELRPLYVKWVRKVMSHAARERWPEPLLTPFDEPAKWVQGKWARAKLYHYRDPNTGGDRLPRVRMKDLDKFLTDRKAEGVTPEYVCDGGADEWIKGHFRDSCAAIHEGWPRARVYGSIHHAEPGIVFLKDVEVFCTNAIHEDNRLGDKVRSGGARKVFWQYSGTGDRAEPAAARYAFGFFFGAFDSRGSLCWAYNWGGRFDTSAGSQWLYAWTTPYSVVRAPFMEGAREAWDDRRYIETLKVAARRRGRQKEAARLLDEIFDAAVRTRTEGGRDTVNDFWARTEDPEALDTMRSRIAGMIARLQR